jgi:two-component system nitrogen regulation response regulator NtrX
MILAPGVTNPALDRAFLGHDGVAVPRAQPAVDLPLAEARDRFERDYILQALAAQGGNMSRTADALGVERSNLYKKMRGFGIGRSLKIED